MKCAVSSTALMNERHSLQLQLQLHLGGQPAAGKLLQQTGFPLLLVL